MTDVAFVDELPKASGRGRAKKYDFSDTYDALLKNGKAAQITRGVHFTCTTTSIRQFLYKDTKERGLKATVRTAKDGDKELVVFTVEKDTGDKKGKQEKTKESADPHAS